MDAGSHYPLTADDVVAQAPCGFDVSVWGFLAVYRRGETGDGRPEAHRDPLAMQRFFAQYGDHSFVPSMLAAAFIARSRQRRLGKAALQQARFL